MSRDALVRDDIPALFALFLKLRGAVVDSVAPEMAGLSDFKLES